MLKKLKIEGKACSFGVLRLEKIHIEDLTVGLVKVGVDINPTEEFDEREVFRYVVTVERGRKTEVFDYWGGIDPREPAVEEALFWIINDALQFAYNNMAEFIEGYDFNTYGYIIDTYNDHKQKFIKFARLGLTAEKLEQLEEKLENILERKGIPV